MSFTGAVAQRVAPPEFVSKLRAEFPDFKDIRFNTGVGRWEFVFLSAAGREVSQFWGWDRDQQTGKEVPPDPVTGLHPFRDLDIYAQTEIIDNCKRTFIGNPNDGAGTWRQQAVVRNAHNAKLRKTGIKRRADDFAYALTQVDLRRPWVKYHQRNKGPKLIVTS